MNVNIVVNLDNALGMLEYLGEGLENMEPLMREMVEVYRTELQPEIFRAHEKGSTGGGGHLSWKPLSEKYLESKVKRQSMHPTDILQLSGAFAEDLTHGGDYTVEDYVSSNNRAQAVFGSTRDYVRYIGAENGGDRQAMYITVDGQRRLEEVAQRYLSDLIAEAREGVVSRTRL